MSELFPQFLRGLVTASMSIILMLSILQPKYGKKVTRLAMLGILIINMLIGIIGYVNGNLTWIARVGLIVTTILCFLIRPLFKESIMQWLFSYITAQNIVMCVMVLSFSFSRKMPYPIYSNTLIRLILFSGIIFIISRYITPIYRQMVTYWNLFFFMALALFAGLVYYFTVGEDIVRTLTDQAVPLHLLVLITVVVYMSIFNSLKTISREYNLREENIRMQNNEELLHLSSSVMANRIKWLLDAQKQSSITSHDHRHFNNTVLELLEQQKTEEAIACLKQQSNVKTNSLKNYCENTLVNATVSYYASLAEEKGILNEINLEIPNDLQVDSLELAMVISNLFENAIHACQELQGGNENDQELTIRFTSRHIGRLVLEISNPCKASIILDENGYPVSKEKGHGVGTKSVLAFANEYKAEIMYQIENGIFRVRMLI